MGTRADFYIGTGPDAEWLGSLAYDGYRIDEMTDRDVRSAQPRFKADAELCLAIKTAATAAEFRAAVVALLAINDDATVPAQGWPWPWNDSTTTDYAYAFVDGGCRAFRCGRGAPWPDMSARKNVAYGKRSGMITLTVTKHGIDIVEDE